MMQTSSREEFHQTVSINYTVAGVTSTKEYSLWSVPVRGAVGLAKVWVFDLLCHLRCTNRDTVPPQASAFFHITHLVKWLICVGLGVVRIKHYAIRVVPSKMVVSYMHHHQRTTSLVKSCVQRRVEIRSYLNAYGLQQRLWRQGRTAGGSPFGPFGPGVTRASNPFVPMRFFVFFMFYIGKINSQCKGDLSCAGTSA